MNKHHTHRILLKDEQGGLCGILSANDITSLCSREREEISHNTNFLKSINASFVATTDVMTIESVRSVSDAVSLMCKHNIGSLPVTKGGKVIGIFSERTLVHYYAKHQ
jgi:CBS domain-containing protein